jgi:hypothetical protein
VNSPGSGLAAAVTFIDGSTGSELPGSRETSGAWVSTQAATRSAASAVPYVWKRRKGTSRESSHMRRIAGECRLTRGAATLDLPCPGSVVKLAVLLRAPHHATIGRTWRGRCRARAAAVRLPPWEESARSSSVRRSSAAPSGRSRRSAPRGLTSWGKSSGPSTPSASPGRAANAWRSRFRAGARCRASRGPGAPSWRLPTAAPGGP